jgi:dolichol-phosphate mannosyltransferase
VTPRSTINSVCVVLPTYNEVDNVGTIVRQLLAIFEASDLDRYQVLVVDDESPDGTAEIVTELMADNPALELLSGPKNGLGSAYSRGFDRVMEQSFDAIVQMDADHSHAPTDIPRLLAALEHADVAIGSRYINGGSIDETWGRRRRLLSRGGNAFARYVAGIYQVQDCTAGFKAIRLSALEAAYPLRLAVQGYVFQVACLHALFIAGAKITEVPIHFTDRKAGTTKLGPADVAEFFIHVWWLRLLSRKTFVKFAITGATGVIVNLGCFQILRELDLQVYLSSVVAIELSIIWNFFLNNFWSFRDRSISSRKRVRGLKFNAVSLVTLALSFVTFVGLRWIFPEQPEIISQLLSIFPAALANYFLNSYWTFKADKV